MQILLLLAAAGLGLFAFLAAVWVFAGWWAKEFDGLDTVVLDLLDPSRRRRRAEERQRLEERHWPGAEDSIYG